jgi:hypothetical protein
MFRKYVVVKILSIHAQNLLLAILVLHSNSGNKFNSYSGPQYNALHSLADHTQMESDGALALNGFLLRIIYTESEPVVANGVSKGLPYL